MPVPAPSLLPPFLSTALLDRSQDSVDLSPSITSAHASSSRLEAPPSAKPERTTSTANTHHWSQTQHADPSVLLPSSSSSLLVPPLNFDMINSGSGSGAIYRSGHPNERNFEFMSTLNLKSIIYLSIDDVRENLQGWIDSTNGSVRLYHFQLKVNKEPFAEMDESIVAQALETILDRRNLPCLIHCNKGKYRVGVVTALIRRLQGWSTTSIFDEYARFAGSDRVADEEVSNHCSLLDVTSY
jgi:tyrosine-protein phosphatase SIW14